MNYELSQKAAVVNMTEVIKLAHYCGLPGSFPPPAFHRLLLHFHVRQLPVFQLFDEFVEKTSECIDTNDGWERSVELVSASTHVQHIFKA